MISHKSIIYKYPKYKGYYNNKYALTFMCLLTSYLIAVLLKLKTAEEVAMAYIKHILPTTSCGTFILQDNDTGFKNSQLITTFKSLGIKPIYSNPYRPPGNSRLESAHNFLKHTISKFLYNSTLEWDDILPIAPYIYNIASLVSDLKSPFFLVFGRDPLEGRLSHLQNYCRYLGTEPGQLAVDKLKCMWKLHAELLHDSRKSKDPEEERKFNKASNLKIGQLVLIKNHTASTFQPKYLGDHRITKIVHDSMVIVPSSDSKEKKCNIHHVKAISATTAFILAFEEFQESIAKESQSLTMTKQTYYKQNRFCH